MASKKIKGITIELGGDSTKLGKAIEDSEKKTRSLQGELRQIERLLKFDPSNVELLTQKQNVLSDAVNETSKKLDILKEAEKEVQEQFKRGEVSADQVRALQREIIKTSNNLELMKNDLKDVDKALENVGNNDGLEKQTMSAEEAKEKISAMNESIASGAKVISAGVVALGGAMAAGGGYALKTVAEFDHALNTLATRTGATKEEMDGLEESMENIYKNNLGESIEDVAVAMATAKNNTKLMGQELEDVTSYALLLRDTFDFEVNESTRTAKMLMDQFGISGEEAYNLIAQGAQNGLDKNGDLLDSINEYAVHYKQLGFTSEEFFNSLVNGASNGTFSVDKLGDAMKEFGIRSKDTAKTTTEGFELIGLNADVMRDKFAQGGEVAKQATKETMQALFGLEDQVKRNQAGVDLFGTMWEDLGEDAIRSLMDMNGSISITKDALDEINEQKYDDLGSALEGLGRTIQTDVVKPLGEELKPVVEDAIAYVKQNAPDIKNTIRDIAEGVGDFVGFVIDNGDYLLSVIAGVGAGFLTWKVYSTISLVVDGIKAFKVATETATIAQAAFNTTMKANPIGLLVSLLGGAVVAIGGLISALANEKSAHEENMEVIQQEMDARQENIDKQNEAIEAGVGEMIHLQNLNNELKNLVDANGKVKAGYENRANFIVNELNTALGLELELTNGQIQGYKDVSSSIDNMIAKKKAEIILEAQLPAYKEAVTKSIEAQTKANELNAEISQMNQDAMRLEMELVNQYGENWRTSMVALNDSRAIELANLQLDTVNKQAELDKQNNLVKGYYDDIASYEANATRLASGTAEDLLAIERSVVSGKATSTGEKISLLQSEATAIQSHIDWMETEYKNGNADVSQAMIDGEKQKLAIVNSEIEGMRSTVETGIPKLTGIWGLLTQGTINASTNIKGFNQAGMLNMDALNQGMNSKNGVVTKTSGKIASGGVKEVKKEHDNAVKAGIYLADGINVGVQSKNSTLATTMGNLAWNMVTNFKNNLKIQSPSRVMAEMAAFVPEGIAMGIDDNADVAYGAMDEMASGLMRSMDGAKLEREFNTRLSLDGMSANVTAQQQSLAQRFNDLYTLVSSYLPEIAQNSNKDLVLDGDMVVGGLIDRIDRGLGDIETTKRRSGQ